MSKQKKQNFAARAITVPTQPIEGQLPGTSGLRKKTKTFKHQNYVENYIQSIFNAIGGGKGKSLVLGGDGRFFSSEATQSILKMAAANGVVRVTVGKNAILSTPAASHLIRKLDADAGLILSASHNPGGPDGDFGIKLNLSNGGPAPDSVTDEIYRETQRITKYQTLNEHDVDVSQKGILNLAGMEIEVIDPVIDYVELMESIFDFSAISELFVSGFTMQFDSMHAVTGPYAKEIFESRLGAKVGSVVNSTPKPDFGGGHPDPNPACAKDLLARMNSSNAPDLSAASDGDGDRCLILGKDTYVSPSDSLAILAANAHVVPAYCEGLKGVARSIPTSMAVDVVGKALRFEVFATPTGWKYFGSLLDADLVSICGEESFGTGSDHIREKDGIWTALMWLNILAKKRKSVEEILEEHWAKFGRHYSSRHDYEEIEPQIADELFVSVQENFDRYRNSTIEGLSVVSMEQVSHQDPISGRKSPSQGLQVWFGDGSRIIVRRSGTGTKGVTIRFYFECYEPPFGDLKRNVQEMLAPHIKTAERLSQFRKRSRRTIPDAII